jgi:MFS family permease
VIAIGECAQFVVLGPLVAELAPPRLLGRYMSLYGLSFTAGVALGPAVGGTLLATSPDAVWWGGALTLALTAAGFLRLGRRIPDPLLQTKSQPLKAERSRPDPSTDDGEPRTVACVGADRPSRPGYRGGRRAVGRARSRGPTRSGAPSRALLAHAVDDAAARTAAVWEPPAREGGDRRSFRSGLRGLARRSGPAFALVAVARLLRRLARLALALRAALRRIALCCLALVLPHIRLIAHDTRFPQLRRPHARRVGRDERGCGAARKGLTL